MFNNSIPTTFYAWFKYALTMKYWFLSLTMFALQYHIVAQDRNNLLFYADVMMNADQAAHREYAHEKFEASFSVMINEPGSFDFRTEEITYISTVYSEDRSFRFISWVLNKEDGKSEYYGFFQRSEEPAIRLAKRRGQLGLSEIGSIAINEWPASIIYRVDQLNENEYLVYTFRQTDKFTRTKTLEIFDVNTLTFGAKASFPAEDGHNVLNRLRLDYSADSNASFDFDKTTRIVSFDNLISMPGRLADQGMTKVADGSFRAYELNTDGTWVYIHKLYEKMIPVLKTETFKSTEGRDINRQRRKRN